MHIQYGNTVDCINTTIELYILYLTITHYLDLQVVLVSCKNFGRKNSKKLSNICQVLVFRLNIYPILINTPYHRCSIPWFVAHGDSHRVAIFFLCFCKRRGGLCSYKQQKREMAI